MKLIDIYKSILSTAGYVVDAEGYVSVNNELFTGEANQPAIIDGKRLVLPTDEHLRNPSDSKIVFHPMKEQAIHGESKVFTNLREAISTRLSFTYAIIINGLIALGQDSAKHKQLTPDQADFLSAVRDITSDTDVVFTELFTRASKEIGGNCFVNIFMKKNGIVNDINYVRVGVVMFPFYEELIKEQDKYFGYTIKSKKDRQTIIRLLEYVMPGISKTGDYNVGNNSKVAPYMGALLGCTQNLVEMLNHHLNLYNTFLDPNYKSMIIDSSWVGAIENEAALVNQIGLIPMQAGNEGTPHLGSQQPSVPTRASIGAAIHPPVQAVQPVQQPVMAVQQAPQPVPVHIPQMQVGMPQQQASTGTSISVSDLINSSQQTQQAAAMANMNLMQNGALLNVAGLQPGMFPMGMLNPMQLQQMQMQAAGAPRSNWQAGAVPAQQGQLVNINGVPMLMMPNGSYQPLQQPVQQTMMYPQGYAPMV